MTAIDGIGAIGSNPLYEAERVKVYAGLEAGGAKADRAEAPAFADVLSGAIESIAAQQKAAESKVTEFASGRSDDVAGMVIAMNRAGLSLQLGLEVRNRVMDAYHEIMRMQV